MLFAVIIKKQVFLSVLLFEPVGGLVQGLDRFLAV